MMGNNLIVTMAALLALPGVASADTRLHMEEITVFAAPGSDTLTEQRSEYTLWMAADRVARVSGDSRMVARLDRGQSYIIDDAQETVTVLELEDLPGALGNTPEVRELGETRTIGEWTAEGYEVTIDLGPGAQGTMVLWISDAVGIDMEAYRAFSRSMDQGRGLMATIASLPGYPVLQEASIGIVSSTTRLLGVADEPAPAGVYEVPAGYEPP